MTRFAALLLTLCLLAVAVPLAAQEATPETTPAPDAPALELFIPEVIAEVPHQTTDFTQGLVWVDGRLFQSAGRYGQSRLQELDPETGEVLREVALDDELFAEGLAYANGLLFQLTWQEGTVLVWDAETFEQVNSFEIEEEGWGLCFDGEVFYHSDGSDHLFVRDAETFEVLETIPVTLDGEPVPQINELECVGDTIWANVWQSPFIIRIDKATGAITGLVDGRSLLTEEMVAAWQSDGAVLNGLAWIPERETWLVTGKDWPVTYEMTFTLLEE